MSGSPARDALACVVGGDMDLVRPLGMAGIGCAVVATPRHATRYSRFTRATLEWRDPYEHADELVDVLVGFAEREREPPVLYYQGDAELLFASRFRSELAPHFRFLLPPVGLVEDLVDKARFAALAQRLDLPVPRSVSFSAATELPAVDLSFPVVVKPLTRTDRWRAAGWGFAKAIEASSAEELRALWPRLTGEILVQELVPGPETSVESHHVYVRSNGELAAEFTGRKIRTHPARYGYSTALELTDAPDVAALGRDIVRRLDLRGVAKLDFKRGPDGALRLLEVNPRFTLWHHLAARAGVNVPALVYDDLVGRDPDPLPPRASAGLRWSDPRHDLAAARANGMTLGGWLAWTARVDVRSGLAWDDPMPFLRGMVWRGLHERLGARRTDAAR